ncbi:Maf family protein [Cellulomonas aerilata]|uniref:Nucleoside triphosphate pyrophosphatase n=1 Tax=Cellulomonas aerilata TaxID=515326 RepID=A0A512DE56_9CELL|nr:nucleoside triphosphate pyrophosphatase [Cellulomonas aerilata]GEO34753.1 Maf-like protein [Cellulomonas aerilata]
MTRLLLASASPARRATLTSAGITPLVRVSGVDEDAVLAAATERFGGLEPADAVLVLAQAKAEQVARALREGTTDVDPDHDGARDPGHDDDHELDDLLVLGCDSMLEIDGEIHGKPADAAQATARWHAMRGRSGVLHTGHWLIDERDPEAGGTGGTLGATSSTVVHFADLSDAEIDAYVATGEPLAVAGSFTVDGLGGAFVTGLEGDHHGVVGVSLPLLRELLGQVGVSVPDLWSLSTGHNAG